MFVSLFFYFFFPRLMSFLKTKTKKRRHHMNFAHVCQVIIGRCPFDTHAVYIKCVF